MYLDSKTLKRFLRKLSIGDGCWEWQASKKRRGYGQFWCKGKNRVASRVAYRHFKGPIPDGMCVCHTCDNPGCCNPAHLWLGTYTDNMQDASTKGRMRGTVGPPKTHCGRGHEYTPNNTYMRPDKPGQRQCRVCNRRRNTESLARRLALCGPH